MEKFKFENQGTNTFLVCDLAGAEIDTMSLGMITDSKIPGLAQAFYTQQDKEMLIKYNISSQIDLPHLFSGVVSKKRLLDVFSGIVTALNTAEEYMLDLNCILLEPEYIFADAASCSVRLICVPVLGVPERENDYGTFFKQIIFSTRFDQMEDCGYVTRIINYLNGAGAFSIEEFGAFLYALENMTGHLTEIQETVSVDRQKKISLFYLMQSYKKENAVQYKEKKAICEQAPKNEKQKKKKRKEAKRKMKEGRKGCL